MSKILLVEDDMGIVKGLVELLKPEGFSVDHVLGQSEAFAALEKEHYDLLLLDVSLSDGNGFSICSGAKEKYGTPVIFLTASGDESSIVCGFDLGADDYIAKPFRLRELVSRIKNVLRRCAGYKNILTAGDIVLDVDRGSVEKDAERSVCPHSNTVYFCISFQIRDGCLHASDFSRKYGISRATMLTIIP